MTDTTIAITITAIDATIVNSMINVGATAAQSRLGTFSIAMVEASAIARAVATTTQSTTNWTSTQKDIVAVLNLELVHTACTEDIPACGACTEQS